MKLLGAFGNLGMRKSREQGDGRTKILSSASAECIVGIYSCGRKFFGHFLDFSTTDLWSGTIRALNQLAKDNTHANGGLHVSSPRDFQCAPSMGP